MIFEWLPQRAAARCSVLSPTFLRYMYILYTKMYWKRRSLEAMTEASTKLDPGSIYAMSVGRREGLRPRGCLSRLRSLT